MSDVKNILAAISGGRSSVRMSRHLQMNPKYKDCNIVYVFCNTGMERKETIDFLINAEKYWGLSIVKIQGVYSNELGIGATYEVIDKWEDLDMQAKTFSKMIDHKTKGKFKGMPNQEAPYCSNELKTIPSQKFAKDYFKGEKYLKALGFRAEDMPKRISWAEIKEDKERIFPLLTDFETPISQKELTEFYRNEEFRLEIHGSLGNCELCWKKSTPNLIKNIKYGTRFIEWYQREELKRNNTTSFRNNQSINQLIELAKLPSTMSIEFEDLEDDFNCVCSF